MASKDVSHVAKCDTPDYEQASAQCDAAEAKQADDQQQSCCASAVFKRPFKLFGIEFAPIYVPLKRRLQTAAVFQSFLFITVWPFVIIALLIRLLLSPFFFLPIIYITWMFYDQKTPRRGGRRSHFIRRLSIWRYFAEYFPITLTKTVDLDPARNYIFASHPHGILSFGAMANFSSEATNFSEKFPGIKAYPLTLGLQFRWPVLRDYLLALGACDVSRDSIRHILTKGSGSAAIIVIGGAEEALEARPGATTIVLRNRKGFIRQAIQFGADLVPCYSFGENDIYYQFENKPGSKVRAFQKFVKRNLSFSPPLIYGRGIFNYSFGIMPHRRPIDTVVGKPLRVEHHENPSVELIDRYHQQYMDALSELFESQKKQHGVADDVHLQFI